MGKAPSEEEFNLPRAKEEWDQMLSMMNQCGIEKSAAKFDSAVEEYKKSQV